MTPARRPRSHRFPNCRCEIFPCQHCAATVIECKAEQHRLNRNCCAGCDHTKPKDTTDD